MSNAAILDLSFSLSSLLWLGWLATFVGYVIFSLIFVYHWRAYATNAAVVRRTFLVYFVGSGIFLLTALVALLLV